MAATRFGSPPGPYGWVGTLAERDDAAFVASLGAKDAGALYFVTDQPGRVDEYNGVSWTIISTGGAIHATDAIAIHGQALGVIALSTTGNQSAALAAGIYDIESDVDCQIKVSTVANNVTAGNVAGGGYKLRSGQTIPIIVPDQYKIGAIVIAGTGTLTFHRVI